MVIIQALTSAIFGEGITRIVKKLNEVKPKDVQIVQVKQDPDGFSFTELEKVKTTSKTWNNKDNANLIFENSLEKESIVKEISLTPDTNFKTKGKVIVTVDDATIFRSKTFDAFEDVVDITIKVNKTIQKDSKVKIFIVNSDDVTEVGLTASVRFGE